MHALLVGFITNKYSKTRLCQRMLDESVTYCSAAWVAEVFNWQHRNLTHIETWLRHCNKVHNGSLCRQLFGPQKKSQSEHRLQNGSAVQIGGSTYPLSSDKQCLSSDNHLEVRGYSTLLSRLRCVFNGAQRYA